MSKKTVSAELQQLHDRCHPLCITNRCRSGDCSLGIINKRMVCIKCDDCKAIHNITGEHKPDFIILYVNKALSCWFVIELKSRVRQARRIVAQLQAGADIIQNNEAFQVANSPSRLVPILVHGRGIHAADVEVLSRTPVLFRGTRHLIKRKHCGGSIADVVPTD